MSHDSITNSQNGTIRTRTWTLTPAIELSLWLTADRVYAVPPTQRARPILRPWPRPRWDSNSPSPDDRLNAFLLLYLEAITTSFGLHTTCRAYFAIPLHFTLHLYTSGNKAPSFYAPFCWYKHRSAERWGNNIKVIYVFPTSVISCTNHCKTPKVCCNS